MTRHARLVLTIGERLEQQELDMTAVHDAIARLSDRLDVVEQVIRERDQSHVDAVAAQVGRMDNLLAELRDEVPNNSQHAADTESPAENLFEPTGQQSGLMS
jgi:ribosome assembly protein YihI (activator of Der GTPase)